MRKRLECRTSIGLTSMHYVRLYEQDVAVAIKCATPEEFLQSGVIWWHMYELLRPVSFHEISFLVHKGFAHHYFI